MRQRYNTHKPYLCIVCGAPVGRRIKYCDSCRKENALTGQYERSPETLKKMSESAKGKKHDYLSASTRPEVANKIKEWWTPERKEAARQKMLLRNPDARYHGLSPDRAREIVLDAGCCSRCGGNGQESRLGVHHKDRNKHNQSPDNLIVLCHKCHMREHSAAGEMGFSVMWKKRKSNQG